MSASPSAGAELVEKAVGHTTARRCGLAVLLALGLCFLYRCLRRSTHSPPSSGSDDTENDIASSLNARGFGAVRPRREPPLAQVRGIAWIGATVNEDPTKPKSCSWNIDVISGEKTGAREGATTEANEMEEGVKADTEEDVAAAAMNGEEEEDPLAATELHMDALAEAHLLAAAAQYNEEWQEKIKKKDTAPREEEGHTQTFIGFSLGDNIREGALVVDGVYDEGPAFQVGIDIDHELIAIAGERAVTIDEVRELIERHCRPGHITSFQMRDDSGNAYTAQLWIMTPEERFRGRPYFFDRAAHEVRQSDRLKRVWRPSQQRGGKPVDGG